MQRQQPLLLSQESSSEANVVYTDDSNIELDKEISEITQLKKGLYTTPGNQQQKEDDVIAYGSEEESE